MAPQGGFGSSPHLAVRELIAKADSSRDRSLHEELPGALGDPAGMRAGDPMGRIQLTAAKMGGGCRSYTFSQSQSQQRQFIERTMSPKKKSTSKVTIYHNPRCTKSRQTLALLREHDVEPTVIEYLKTPPDAATLKQLLKKLGMKPQGLIRRKEYRALGLEETDDPGELIARMVDNPQIIERPIVVRGSAARLGRPPEAVLEILA